jgi:hypothetical protein
MLLALASYSGIGSLAAPNPPLATAETPSAAAAAPDAAPSPASAAEPSIPDDVRAAITEVLRNKVKALVDERDKDGVATKRGSYSRHYRKAGTNAYQVAFHRDTIQEDQSLVTERFLLTVSKAPATAAWSVTKEELQDTYRGLFRAIADGKDTSRFDSLTLSREGLTVRGGKGWLNRTLHNGQLVGMLVTAENLTYEYVPPVKLAALLFDKLKEHRKPEIIFQPDFLEIICDPVSCQEILAKVFSATAPGELAEAQPMLRKRFEEDDKEAKKEIKENAFGRFYPPPEPDRRWYRIAVRADSPDRRIAVEYDNFEPKEVSFWAYNLDKAFGAYNAKVYTYYSEATRKSGIPEYDLELRDDAEARYYDLKGIKGTVELALEDAEQLTADITFTIETKRELRELPFFIVRVRQTESERKDAKKPQLLINSIEDAQGREMTWVKTGPISGRVILPEKVPAKTPLTIRMQFENKAALYKFTPTFSYVSRFGWIPFVRFTDMIHDFDLTVKTPARYKTLGIGRLVSEVEDGGVRTTRWTSDNPVEFPSITIGEYLVEESSVKATKIDGTPIPVRVYVDKLGKVAHATKFMEDLANQAANSLNLYREIYGADYPYAKLDMVNDPLGSFYGQSPSSLIYLGNGVFLGQGQVGDMGGGQLSKFNRDVVAHEVAHQWWGSLIPNYNDYNYWFVESLAEYSSALYVEANEGLESYRTKVEDWRREILEADLWCSVQDASIVWTGDLFRGYRAAVYAKGPYMFHIMRHTWGEEKFFKFLKMLAQELQHKAIVTRDIQKIAEKAYGGNMDFFFDQWVRGTGLPEYTFTYSTRPTEDGKVLIEGKITQRLLLGRQELPLGDLTYRAVVPVTVVMKGGKEYRYPILVEGKETPFKFKVAETPKEVVFNRYGESLAHDVLTN